MVDQKRHDAAMQGMQQLAGVLGQDRARLQGYDAAAVQIGCDPANLNGPAVKTAYDAKDADPALKSALTAYNDAAQQIQCDQNGPAVWDAYQSLDQAKTALDAQVAQLTPEAAKVPGLEADVARLAGEVGTLTPEAAKVPGLEAKVGDYDAAATAIGCAQDGPAVTQAYQDLSTMYDQLIQGVETLVQAGGVVVAQNVQAAQQAAQAVPQPQQPAGQGGQPPAQPRP